MTKQIKVHLILSVFIVLTCGLYGLGGLAYLAGITNSSLLLLLAVIPFLPLVGLSVVSVVYQFYRILRPREVYTLRVRRIILAGALTSVVALFGTLWFFQPWWTCQAKGFLYRMKMIRLEQDLPIIRTWLIEIKNTDTYPFLVNVTKCPDAIKRLRPRHVWIGSHSYDAEIAVSLTWGGGPIGAWGVVVGPVEMEVPKSAEDEIILPLAPGAFVFRSIDID